MPREIVAKTILNKTKRRDPWFLDDYTVNLYSSCGYNCLFCYIRGSKYGENLEERLSVKANAIELLDRQLGLRAKKGQYGFIVLSSATEPYQRLEGQYGLMRSALEIILKYRFPVHVITRSDLVQRDFDLLAKIDQAAILPADLKPLGRGALLTFSFSTLDDAVAAIFEPGATPPSQRLVALRAAKAHGFKAGVSLMPLLPFISDTTAHLEWMFSTFKAAQADYVMPATLTLFGHDKADSKTLVLNAVRKHYPDLLARYEKYFAHGTEMPAYYRTAFYKKMKALAEEYGLPDRIFP